MRKIRCVFLVWNDFLYITNSLQFWSSTALEEKSVYAAIFIKMIAQTRDFIAAPSKGEAS